MSWIFIPGACGAGALGMSRTRCSGCSTAAGGGPRIARSSRPQLRQRDPEEPITATQLRPVHRPLIDRELVAQREVLKGELAVAPAEEREESKQVEQEADHEERLYPHHS